MLSIYVYVYTCTVYNTMYIVYRLIVIRIDDDVGLHVDCCLGGFVLPFARRLGYDIPSKLICSIFICKLQC